MNLVQIASEIDSERQILEIEYAKAYGGLRNRIGPRKAHDTKKAMYSEWELRGEKDETSWYRYVIPRLKELNNGTRSNDTNS